MFSDGSDTYSLKQPAVHNRSQFDRQCNEFLFRTHPMDWLPIIPGEKARPTGSIHGAGHSQ